jgi:hypothetical protein
MRKNLEEKIARRWPGWFDVTGDPVSSPTERGFEHRDGQCAAVGYCVPWGKSIASPWPSGAGIRRPSSPA